VAELIAEGDRRQWSSARFRAELAGWTRPNGTLRRDGMPGYAVGMSGAAALVQPLVIRFRDSGADEAERDRRRATGCKALLVLSTPRDGKREWIAAGEALQRVLLRATASGLFASWFSQPVEDAELRRRLRDVLAEPDLPQVVFRLGYGLQVRPVPRRPVDEVLRRIDAGPPRAAALALRTPPTTTRGAAPRDEQPPVPGS
jgi:hypothetical protein